LKHLQLRHSQTVTAHKIQFNTKSNLPCHAQAQAQAYAHHVPRFTDKVSRVDTQKL